LPGNALPPFNIYVGDELLQSTGAPTGSDDESPDPKDENEGFGHEVVIVSNKNRLALELPDDQLALLACELKEIDKLAEISAKLDAKKAIPPDDHFDFPDPDERAESDKIIRILKKGMRTLWRPVECAIVDRVTMSS